jgi:hypothetical protein
MQSAFVVHDASTELTHKAADHVSGASVGDSRAWIVCDGDVNDLTAKQVRKPLLGSGMTVISLLSPTRNSSTVSESPLQRRA